MDTTIAGIIAAATATVSALVGAMWTQIKSSQSKAIASIESSLNDCQEQHRECTKTTDKLHGDILQSRDDLSVVKQSLARLEGRVEALGKANE